MVFKSLCATIPAIRGTMTHDNGRRGGGARVVASGHVQTLDHYLGYVFTSRRESPEEYRQRTSPSAGPAAAGPPRVFRLIAGFAEHDERLGSRVSIEVRRETAPARDEAEELVWPAIWEETTRALGAGDWRPSLNWLDVIELQPLADIYPEHRSRP